MALLLLTSIAAAVALAHINNPTAFIAIAPGYLVQAWLFETHHALGGFWYQVTMVWVSAVVWTLVILSPALAVRPPRRPGLPAPGALHPPVTFRAPHPRVN